jgi:hypothetical protein
MKWTMEQTHMTKDISELEVILETIAIEIFISDLADERAYLDVLLVEKPWEEDEDEEDVLESITHESDD